MAYSCLLKNELLGASIEDVKGQCDERRALVPLEGMNLFQVQKKMHASTHVFVCVCMCVYKHEWVCANNSSIVTVTIMFKLIT